MKSYNEIKEESEAKLSKLLADCRVFFAFSNQQFEENKTPLDEGDRYVAMGYGGYLPKSMLANYLSGSKEITTWEKEQIAENKQEEVEILSELHNYECFYVNDIEDCVDAIGYKYSREQIMSVYRKNYDEAMVNIC